MELATILANFGLKLEVTTEGGHPEKLQEALSKWQQGCPCACDDTCTVLRHQSQGLMSLSNLVCHLKCVLCPGVYQRLLIATVEWYLIEFVGCFTQQDHEIICRYVKCTDPCDVIDLVRRLDPVCNSMPCCEDYATIYTELGLALPVDRPFKLKCELDRWNVPICHYPFFASHTEFSTQYKACRTYLNFVTILSQTADQTVQCLLQEQLLTYSKYVLRRTGFWTDVSTKLCIVPSSDPSAADITNTVCNPNPGCAPCCPVDECAKCESCSGFTPNECAPVFPAIKQCQPDTCPEELVCESDSESESDSDSESESESESEDECECESGCESEDECEEKKCGCGSDSGCDKCEKKKCKKRKCRKCKERKCKMVKKHDCWDPECGPCKEVDCDACQPVCPVIIDVCPNDGQPHLGQESPRPAAACTEECNEDKKTALCTVESLISILNGKRSKIGKRVAKLFAEGGVYFDSLGQVAACDLPQAFCFPGPRVPADDECAKYTLRRFYWDQKNHSFGVELEYSAVVACDRIYGFDNPAGYQTQTLVAKGTKICQDVAWHGLTDCCGQLNFLRVVKVNSRPTSTYHAEPIPCCGPVGHCETRCDPDRDAALAVLTTIIEGIAQTSTDPVASLNQILTVFTNQTAWTGGGNRLVGPQAFYDDLIVYACGSGPVSDPHFAAVPQCQNLPFYYDVETKNYAVLKGAWWDQCARTLVVEWTWKVDETKKTLYFGDPQNPTIIQPGGTYQQDDIVIITLDCDLKVSYYREYFDGNQYQTTYPPEYCFPEAAQCESECSSESSDDTCDLCEEPEMWPCGCHQCCKCREAKSCATKYAVPQLPTGWSFTQTTAWELRRMFNIDCVLKNLEYKQLNITALPNHDIVVRRASNQLAIKLWSAQGLCDVLALSMCDAKCTSDPDILVIVKTDVVKVLFGRLAQQFNTEDTIKVGKRCIPVTTQLLYNWLQVDKLGVINSILRSWRDGGIDRCRIIEALGERLCEPQVRALFC